MYSVKWPFELYPAGLIASLGGLGLYKLQIAESFVVSAVVGAILMTLLKWKYRLLAIVAFPAFILFWFPYQTSRQARDVLGPEYTFTFYFWNHLPYFASYLVGASIGAAMVWFIKRRHIPSAA